MSRRTSVLMAAVVGVLGGAIVGGSALVGATAQSPFSQSGSSQSPSSQSGAASAGNRSAEDRPCGALLERLPDELRADLKAAQGLPAGQERLDAIRKVARDARDGAYGTMVERVAEKRFDHRKELWRKLSSDLRADLRELRNTSGDERKAAVENIRKAALDGEYGAKVQQFAQRLQERREACRP